jgi:DnaK suppressor protein
MTNYETIETGRAYEVLEAEAAVLRLALRNREDITIEFAPEEHERISMAGQRELALVLVSHESRRLREVEAAQRRISEGCYGTCADCEEPIPAKRLTAIPWASRCVRCQETADRVRSQTEWDTPSASSLNDELLN